MCTHIVKERGGGRNRRRWSFKMASVRTWSPNFVRNKSNLCGTRTQLVLLGVISFP